MKDFLISITDELNKTTQEKGLSEDALGLAHHLWETIENFLEECEEE